MKRIFFLLLALITIGEARAQFIVGWSAGYAPTRELNREIYVYNAINGHNLTKEMNEVHWYQGPVVGFRYTASDGFIELLYNRKRTVVGSEFDSSGVEMTRELKTLLNTWNFGIGRGNEEWTIGCSFDFGRYKGFGRRGTKSAIGDVAWDKLWVLRSTRILFISTKLVLTETIFIERHFEFINVRLFAQFPGISVEMDGLDSWLFGGDLNYASAQKQRPFNIGTSITFSIGGR